MLLLVTRTAQSLSSLTEGLSGLLHGAIVVINVLQVVFRYVIGAPLGWTEEVMRYAVVWLTFLASTAALHRGEHMVIDVLGPVLPDLLQRLQAEDRSPSVAGASAPGCDHQRAPRPATTAPNVRKRM